MKNGYQNHLAIYKIFDLNVLNNIKYDIKIFIFELSRLNTLT